MANALDGCTVVLAGAMPGGHGHGVFGQQITSNGGTYAAKITRKTTHLVATEKEIQDEKEKIRQALDRPDIHIVSVDWVIDSIATGQKADEQLYLMIKPPQTSAKKDVDAGRKRDREAVKTEPESEDEESVEPPAKKQKDGEVAGSSTLNVRVDEGCPMAASYKVFIGQSNMIYDASLNQTNAGQNNNKYYRIQLLQSTSDANKLHTWTRWGRVGEHGSSKLLGDGSFDDAFREFEKKFKDKTGLKWADRLQPPKKGKYTFLEMSYEPDESEDEIPADNSYKLAKSSLGSEKAEVKVESKLAKPVQNLMKLIFNQEFFADTLASMAYDANKLPLGKLSKRTLMQGYEALKDLAELLINPSLAEEVHNAGFEDAVQDLSNAYYTFIPHDFGRRRPPVIRNNDLLKREIELLESLSDMKIAEEIMKKAKDDGGEKVHWLDRQFAGINMNEMEALEHKSSEFIQLEDYLLKTHGRTHSIKFKVQDIFRIERHGENDRFERSHYAELNADRRLLWHGSRCTNFGGILSQGLRIAPPEAPVNGYMFGKGVYLADISSKSANYCQHSTSGNIGLLLLCDAELGSPMLELTDSDYNASEVAKEKGCHSTFGKGLVTPDGWKDASCVHDNLKGVLMPDTTRPPTDSLVPNAYLQYNEYICYDTAQIRLRYLFRVHMG